MRVVRRRKEKWLGHRFKSQSRIKFDRQYSGADEDRKQRQWEVRKRFLKREAEEFNSQARSISGDFLTLKEAMWLRGRLIQMANDGLDWRYLDYGAISRFEGLSLYFFNRDWDVQEREEHPWFALGMEELEGA
jgi:hypothetical protein